MSPLSPECAFAGDPFLLGCLDAWITPCTAVVLFASFFAFKQKCSAIQYPGVKIEIRGRPVARTSTSVESRLGPLSVLHQDKLKTGVSEVNKVNASIATSFTALQRRLLIGRTNINHHNYHPIPINYHKLSYPLVN